MATPDRIAAAANAYRIACITHHDAQRAVQRQQERLDAAQLKETTARQAASAADAALQEAIAQRSAAQDEAQQD